MSEKTRKYLPIALSDSFEFIISLSIYLSILKRIQRRGEKAKKQFIKKCDNEFIDCVSECAKNGEAT